MEFIWANDRKKKNTRLTFELRLKEACDTLLICAADVYQVYVDGKLAAYGPERCAAGYSKKKEIDVRNARELKIKVIAHNVPNYECDLQEPFFGAEVIAEGRTVYSSSDFTCYTERSRISDMPRYDGQRGFAEGYDLTRNKNLTEEVYTVDSPEIIDGIGEVCDYISFDFSYIGSSPFTGFDEIVTPNVYKNAATAPRAEDFSPEEFIQKMIKSSAHEYNYKLTAEHTGFLVFDIDAEEECEFIAVFEEITPEGKWIFRRSNCNDFVYVKSPRGRHRIITAEPYALRLLKIVTSCRVSVTPSLIAYENNRAVALKVSGDERVRTVIEAAHNSFIQNAVDIFTDCPGRERAGWLCDSYFTAKAELLFSGSNRIERAFLENFILARTPELAHGMLPMCFPGEHPNGRYIPNWAMWFVIELKDYLTRSGDRDLIERARNKVYGVISFFEKFKNSDGLLEDLESWVFIEWSIANDESYVSGVNFPSNMLYAQTLITAGELYSDEELVSRGLQMKETIKRLSYNGSFFADNATRSDGKLIRRDDHISETCQYYALFFGIETDSDFKKKMIEEFGPGRAESSYPEIGRSNMFIGNYLRLFWLLSIGEEARVLSESLDYFSRMAMTTGTLWEHDRPRASCNHGFASSAAVILMSALTGYETTRGGTPVFRKDFTPPDGYDITVNFNYNTD